MSGVTSIAGRIDAIQSRISRLEAMAPNGEPSGGGRFGSLLAGSLAGTSGSASTLGAAPSPAGSAGGASIAGLTAGATALRAGALGGAATASVQGASGLTGSTTGTASTTGVGGMASATAVGQAVVDAAAQYLGIPYLWGGTEASTGFDCSGLVQQAFADIGVGMPKWSRHQAEMGVEIPSIELARPGDVLSFGEPVNHVALYVGNGQMLHAPRTGEVVKIEAIDRPIGSIRRIVAGGTAGTLGVDLGVGDQPTSGSEVLSETALAPLFEAAGAAHGIDPALLAAVASVESGFRADAVSPAGAQGLMQFMPATAASLDVDPFDPASAIDGAARYLRSNLDRFGTVELALAAYNAGPGAVERHGGVPPFAETQNYVTSVSNAWKARS